MRFNSGFKGLNQYEPENRDLLEMLIGTKIKIKKVAFRKPKAHQSGLF